jgi:hypothetical protein
MAALGVGAGHGVVVAALVPDIGRGVTGIRR